MCRRTDCSEVPQCVADPHRIRRTRRYPAGEVLSNKSCIIPGKSTFACTTIPAKPQRVRLLSAPKITCLYNSHVVIILFGTAADADQLIGVMGGNVFDHLDKSLQWQGTKNELPAVGIDVDDQHGAANTRTPTFGTNERMRLGTVYAGGDDEVQQQNEDNVNRDRDGREQAGFRTASPLLLRQYFKVSTLRFSRSSFSQRSRRLMSWCCLASRPTLMMSVCERSSRVRSSMVLSMVSKVRPTPFNT